MRSHLWTPTFRVYLTRILSRLGAFILRFFILRVVLTSSILELKRTLSAKFPDYIEDWLKWGSELAALTIALFLWVVRESIEVTGNRKSSHKYLGITNSFCYVCLNLRLRCAQFGRIGSSITKTTAVKPNVPMIFYLFALLFHYLRIK